ncbi:YhdP family protein [Limnobacter litoralis]|uniref:YhdP central domain-containing protein n=1 Tax=Limnobacter litoralis TaxID=481366 RepID=A0ABQ5YPS3_9BURK|nr:YhdP family protein [Limnobacter litoralis]GLR26127.1 hypothetical protein GCM10007875_12150 [Limnobacter litoralis]
MSQLNAIWNRINHKQLLHFAHLFACAVLIAVALGLIALKWWILPRADSYRPWIESAVSQQIGAPFTIGQIQAQWRGLSPTLQIKDLRVQDKDGNDGLNVDAAFVRLSWTSLLTFSPRFSQIELEKPQLSAWRDSDGLLHVAGIAFPASKDTSNPGLNWLLHQGQLALHQAKLDWRDLTGQTPNLAVSDIDLILKNGFGRHRLGVRANVPALTPDALSLTADFGIPVWERQLDNWSSWKGTAYAQFALPDLAFFQPWLGSLPVNVAVAGVRSRAWLDFQAGEITKATLQTTIGQLALNARQPEIKPLQVSEVSALFDLSGQVSLRHPSAVSVRGLRMRFSDGERFGPADFSVSRSYGDSAQNWTLTAQNLDAAQARRLTLEVGQNLGQGQAMQGLSNYTLNGNLNRVKLDWQTPLNSDQPNFNALAFNADVNVEDLSILYSKVQPDGGVSVTGFKGLTGEFKGNNREGRWKVDSKKVDLALPEVFAASFLDFDQVDGQGSWSHLFDPSNPLLVKLDRLHVNNRDVDASVQGTYQLNHQSSDVIDLNGDLNRAEVAAVPKYLPLIVGPQAREWLAGSLKGGLASKGKLVLKGPLDQFPFHETPGVGVFSITVPVEKAELKFAPDWPAITDIKGNVSLKGKNMHILAESAKTQGALLQGVNADIDNLDAWEPVLKIKGTSKGALQDMVSYVNASPVNGFVGGLLTTARAQGNALLKLDLNLPLNKLADTTVNGTLAFEKNTVQLLRGMPKVSALNGNLGFSDKGIKIDGLKGVALGEPVLISGSTNAQGQIAIRATGQARARELADYVDSTFAPYMSGATPFTVNVVSNKSGLNVLVNSTLQGLGVNLPPPFGKSADSAVPLKIRQTVGDSGEDWNVSLGQDDSLVGLLKARFVPDGNDSRFASLNFAVGVPLENSSSGINGTVRAQNIDMDRWKSIFSGLFDPIQVLSGKAQSSDSLLGLLRTGKGGLPKTRVNLQADHLVFGKKQFDSVWVTARTVENRWQFDVRAAGVDGYLSWVSDETRPDGAVLARFKKLSIPKSLDSDMKSAVEDPVSSIPALDIEADDFTLNGLKLGKLSLLAFNQTRDERARATLNDKPKEWRLEKLVLENPESVTRANGIWQYGQKLSSQSTDLQIDQTVKDAGGLLTRLGMAGVFKGGEGTLKGRLKWDDAPTAIDYGSLSGQFKLVSKNGQFLKADPGVAKLLGVLSLQSIPRRFALDFKDIFSKGFAYDSIDADVTLKRGVATTRNFKMQGPSATVLMQGDLNLKEETQNLNVVVLPDLNPTGGSLLYSLIAANPAVGLASIIADFVFKDPLAKVFSFQYKVTGAWDAPNIERVKGQQSPEQATPKQ